MQKFIVKHQDKITSVLSCFDRVLFKGYLPLGYPQGMENFLNAKGLLLYEQTIRNSLPPAPSP